MKSATDRIGPACSSTHVPGYINHPKLKEAGQVFVLSVNDPFVYDNPARLQLNDINLTDRNRTKAWGTSLDPTGKSGVCQLFLHKDNKKNKIDS